MSNVKKSFFMEYIFPTLLTGAVAASLNLVGMYFAVRSLDYRVSAVESTYVRKDVLKPQLDQIVADILEIKQDQDIVAADVKELLKRR